MSSFFISGIDTNVGKTVFSAIMAKAFGMNYWKPVQAGELENTDSMFVQTMVPDAEIFPETYRLKTPASPHIAGGMENIVIDLDQFNLPVSPKPLVVEGAGGVLVPLNDHFYIIDLIKKINLKVILVTRNYLGCINHSLLTYEALRSRNIDVAGWVFNGEKNSAVEESIIRRTNSPILLRILPETGIDKNTIEKYAKSLKENERLLKA